MLTPQMQDYINEKVRVGRYASAEDVLQAGLAALIQQEEVERMDGDALDAVYPGARDKVRTGLEQAKAGRLTDGDAFFDELEREP